MRQISRFISTVFFNLKVYGVHNIPRTGGVILVSNHQSYLDSVLLALRIHRVPSYMARAETFNNRFFAPILRSVNAFPISQGTGDIGAIKESIARLNAGHLLTIFPEGSRSDNGRIKPLEKGVSLIIRRTRVPVVPVVIVGSFKAWPKGQRFPRPAPIRILYGPPMVELWKLDSDEIITRIDRTLHRMFDDFRAGRIPPGPRRPVVR